ncbi:MAG: hypothetical protein KME45_30920 [Stenomitos rutilans HA7619-LM2]|jgi:hypothetical protein|nr:hypothetical protein [Stenomitos rutilans HA7619-LM2]
MTPNEDARAFRAEVPVSPSTPLGLTETTIAKLAEYGGFIASVLALCLFFWVLTQFVKEVKED